MFAQGGCCMKHEEAVLHLKFCKWIDKNYPNDPYVRHEKERQRSKFLQSLMQVYNNIDGLPDFELILPCGDYNGLYIEFKKPGEAFALQNGYVAKSYEHQYKFHLHAWSVNRCAYFANDFNDACVLYSSYRSGNPLPMQELLLRDRPQDAIADAFFDRHGV